MARVRFLFTTLILFLLIGAGIAWLLSSRGVIPNIWSPSLGTIFSVLGVLIAFVQWTLPLPSSDPKPSTESKKSSHAREMFREQIYDQLKSVKGALVIYEKRDKVGRSIWVSSDSEDQTKSVTANVVERMVNGYSLAAAIFPGLEPDTYKISGKSHYSDEVGKEGYVTIFSGHVAEVDWRRDDDEGDSWEVKEKLEQKARQKQSSQAALRLQSVAIGLGGMLFLTHKYMGLPYLDIAGISSIVLGVVNLLSTLVLDWLGWLKNRYRTYGTYFVRPWVMVIELGGVLFFAHRYTAFPHLDIIGIIVMALGVVALVIALFVAYG